MTGPNPLPSLERLKQEARHIRTAFEARGGTMTHSQSLEQLAQGYGFRNWNTLRAAAEASRSDPPYRLGARIAGAYLGHAFTGEILSLSIVSDGRTRLTIAFDAPVDVVRFDSFSALRHRVTGTVTREGVSHEKTSNGTPHLRITRVA